jgi:tight adherence protein C
VADGLPEVVDLLLLCCSAGIALPLAHPLVADHLPPPIGPALHAADAATSAGLPRADALVQELGRLGDRATALAHVLADHLRYGVALAPALDRLGLELRLDRRRRAEQDARRVPVRLLAPLVTCVLPAFGLLTVVPLLVASLRSLPT